MPGRTDTFVGGRQGAGSSRSFPSSTSGRRRRVSPAGQEGEFCLIQTPDWVNVVPVLRGASGDERFLMVRQFRQGAGIVTTEFPAGLVEPGEDPRDTALRELREETGQAAGRLTLIGKVAPNPAFMTNWCYTYLAEDLSPSEGAHADELELLETREVGARELAETHRHGRVRQLARSRRLDAVQGLRGKGDRRRSELNRCMKVLQTSPLPLGYGALANLPG